MNFISNAEEAMFTESRLENASTKELTRMYALAQAHMLSSLDNVKKVADMRLDAMRAAGGAEGVAKMFGTGSDEELNALAGIPALDAPGRDKVRKLISGLVDAMDADDSVQLDDSDDSDED